MGQVDGKVALVTGGSRGIGRAVVVELAACGYTVAVGYRKESAAVSTLVEQLAQRIHS